MAHPLYHARASASRYGGSSMEYLELHEWMDQAKVALPDCRHRLVLHNTWGLELAVRTWGESLSVSPDRAPVSVRTLIEEHIVEDLGSVPSLGDCLTPESVPPSLQESLHNLASELDDATVGTHAAATARRFGGSPDDYTGLHTFMDSPKHELPDWRHCLLTHNAFGPFLAATVFGRTFRRPSDGVEIPVRSVAETHILDDLGYIPTLAECLANVPLRAWMCRRAVPLSRMSTSRSSSRSQEQVRHAMSSREVF